VTHSPTTADDDVGIVVVGRVVIDVALVCRFADAALLLGGVPSGCRGEGRMTAVEAWPRRPR
jgi:hypothetical protein